MLHSALSVAPPNENCEQTFRSFITYLLKRTTLGLMAVIPVFVTLVLAQAVSGQAIAQTQPNERFLLFEDIGQRGTPDLSSLGINKLRAIPTAALWSEGADRSEPDFDAIRSAIARNRNELSLICLNIEHWPVHERDASDDVAAAELARNVSKLRAIAQFVRGEFPSMRVGYYSLVPVREYNAIIRNDVSQLSKWHQQNEALRPLASDVDIIYPSLYTFSHDAGKWRKYAIANILQARTYGKPVIVFLWPQVHPSNLAQGLQFVDGHFWRTMLETAFEYADGAIIWTPKSRSRQTNFDPNAAWWLATEEFARHIRQPRSPRIIELSATIDTSSTGQYNSLEADWLAEIAN